MYGVGGGRDGGEGIEVERARLDVSSGGKVQGCMYRIVGRDKVAWAEASIELEGVDRVERDRLHVSGSW